MREIKFRAWAAKYKQMYWFDIMWGNKHATGSGWIGMLPISETERGYGLYRDNRVDVDPNDCELMQYTGFKDSFGKEIYEGDILSCEGGDDWPNSSLVSDVLFGHDLQWQVRSFLEGIAPVDVTHGLPVNWGGWKSIEVIGNIYENPDLLSSEQDVEAEIKTEPDAEN